MKAIGFNRPLPVSDENCLLDVELPTPELRERDLLVEVRAVSVNPADVKVRAAHTPAERQYRVLGWDAAGVVKAVGSGVRHFQVGDEVYYAGVINRPGSYAQMQAVDERIVARKPRTLDFAQAAALPLTALTAWETLFDRLDVNKPVAGGSRALLLVGGAGGVGSITVQLLKTLTDIQIIA
ncbi:alcohol dehydrogenase catalytic domain-containing protein, partial [Kingella oralis]